MLRVPQRRLYYYSSTSRIEFSQVKSMPQTQYEPLLLLGPMKTDLEAPGMQSTRGEQLRKC